MGREGEDKGRQRVKRRKKKEDEDIEGEEEFNSLMLLESFCLLKQILATRLAYNNTPNSKKERRALA